MEKTIKVLAISGSLRQKSSNTALMHAIKGLARENMNFTVYRGSTSVAVTRGNRMDIIGNKLINPSLVIIPVILPASILKSCGLFIDLYFKLS